MALKGYWGFVVRKITASLIILFAIISSTFVIFRMMPGDPVQLMFNDPRLSRQDMELLYERFGLTGSMWEQFVAYLRQLLLHGDLGMSFMQQRPVMDVLVSRIPQTVLLMVVAIIVALLIGISLGTIAGWRTGSRFDTAVITGALTMYGIPTFCMGIILLLVFGVYLKVFPIGGYSSPVSGLTGFAYLLDVARHLVLPALAVTLWYIGAYILITRNSIHDVLDQDYIVLARAKGLKESTVIRKHGLRNALLPVTTATGLYLAHALGGAVQAEVVFAWPGLGLLMYESIIRRDYPVLQGAFLVMGIVIIVANLLVDLVYGLLDPRIKVGGG